MKHNVFALKRPPRRTKTVAFESSANPGVTFELKLRALDAVDALNVAGQAEEMHRTYVVEGVPFFAVDGEPIEVGKELLTFACTVWKMQVGEVRYTPEEVVAMLAAVPEAMPVLVDAVNELNAEGPLGNLGTTARISTEVSSDPSSDSQSDTQNSTAG